jgi:Glycosyl hydrolase family 63 C-terminal domain
MAAAPHDARDPERVRLAEARDSVAPWYRWGPYLADRQWGTVREDYSATGEAWTYVTHDDARSRAYRWGEDGLLGICDDQARLCFALALWNGADPILKERLYGLTGPEGVHGEDVKEAYHYLDATPTASYLRAAYLYPQRAFPYEALLAGNAARSRSEPEFELTDTNAFDDRRYFTIEVEYAKAGPEDLVIRLRTTNHAAVAATLDLLPTLWFRNTWAWGIDDQKPVISQPGRPAGPTDSRAEARTSPRLRAEHHSLGRYWLAGPAGATVLLTENESDARRLWGAEPRTAAVKDAFHAAVIHGDRSLLVRDPEAPGTKAALWYRQRLGAGQTRDTVLRLWHEDSPGAAGQAPEKVLAARRKEADAFHAGVSPSMADVDRRRVQRQALAGLVWTKQWYHFDVARWLTGDPAGPAPPPERRDGRNSEWTEFHAADVLSMPDTWEYPWFAAWDLAFHCVPFALIDPDFAKQQLHTLTQAWYLHPNGQLPAYEWAFSDVNPPVHAWAAWRVYKIDARTSGRPDRDFLERVFQKMLLNFTWWVNRKDRHGHGVFQGGFLGLDNVGVFDRNARLPRGGHLGQADGTAWMGFYSLTMMAISLELARGNRVYEDLAVKFFEHFLYIAAALNDIGQSGIPLWDEEDGFFYDVLHLPDDAKIQLKLRSMVGLIPLLAVETIEPELLQMLPNFAGSLRWFLENRPDLASLVSRWEEPGVGRRHLLALVRGSRMKRLLHRMLDPEEFLSPFGVRSLSRHHRQHPYQLDIDGMTYRVGYEPGESETGVFGGNSNWRGPVWFPINYLLIEALQRFHHYYGDDFHVEAPTGSGAQLTLHEVAADLSERLIRLFLRDESGNRPFLGSRNDVTTRGTAADRLLFHEYFHGDTGAGLGASHQTGWTALVAKLLDQQSRAGSHG